MRNIFFFAVVIALAMAAAGCAAMLENKPTADGQLAQINPQLTNDVNAIAWLKVIKAVNQSANPTSTNAPLDAALGGLIAIVTAAATTYQHRQTANQAAALALRDPNPKG